MCEKARVTYRCILTVKCPWWQGALVGKPILATTSWLFVTFDTAGEVPAALVRCRGVEKIWCLDVEVYSAIAHRSPGGWRMAPPHHPRRLRQQYQKCVRLRIWAHWR